MQGLDSKIKRVCEAQRATRAGSGSGVTSHLGSGAALSPRNPEPPRRRLGYPRGGTEGGEVPRGDSGSVGEPEGQDRRAPSAIWSQLSEGVRVELTRPLRVESGRTSSPGVDPSLVDHRDLRQGGQRLPGRDPTPRGGAAKQRIQCRLIRPRRPRPGRRRPRNRWNREKLAKTKGGSGESDINNEGNDHTGRRITLGR